MTNARLISIFGGLVLLLAVGVGSTTANHVPPVFVAGNPDCQDLGFDFGFKVDPPLSGHYTGPLVGDPPAYIDLTVTSATHFDWASNLTILAVISKGGPNANVYYYNPPATFSDTGLHSPINPANGQPFGLSHVEFCYDDRTVPEGDPLDVEKTANGTSDLRYTWLIDKAVDQTSVTATPPGSVTFNYTVTVSHDAGVVSNYAVSGVITVSNTNAYPVTGVTITDQLSDATVCTVTGGVNAVIPAAGSANFNYSCLPPNAAAVSNAVTVSWPDQAGPPVLPAGNAVFVAPINWTQNVIDECVNVTDTYAGNLGMVCVGDANPTVFNYSRTVPIPEFGCQEYDNTATFTTTDTGTTGSDSVTVEVCSTFEGCTPGYWKQTQHFDSWVATGFNPNQTVGSVFAGAAANPYHNNTLVQALEFGGGGGVNGAKQILLRAAVAAVLNASHPDIDYQFTTAQVINSVNAALASGNRATILALASDLDDANNAGCPLN